ncbi:hypothetical protein C8Q75DRAFT_718813 [Abortiporus biennis]|nr:hypothetical protein C8Q75DRAFT_718813 [Abortiporus biennis]
MANTPATVLSLAQSLLQDATSDISHCHPFSSNPEPTLQSLRNIIQATEFLSQNVTTQLSIPLAESKSISTFRQYTSLANNVYNAEQTMRQTARALRERTDIIYGENIPLDRSQLVDWAVSRLEIFATSAGMETFREDEREGHMTVVFGGKILVIDIDFLVDRSMPLLPSLGVAAVKTSYAVPNAAAATSTTTGGSVSLDGFLADHIRSFLTEVQKEEQFQDTIEAARIGKQFSEHLKYLMKLDQLAVPEGDSGLRWFRGVDQLATEILEPFATKEAQVVARSLSTVASPLDIFLTRAHTLPLPYLISPSISFLVYLSPLAYLSLLRSSSSSNPSPSKPKLTLPDLDIPFSHIRSQASQNKHPGITIATLILKSVSSPSQIITPDPDTSMNIHDLASRPTFPLVPQGSQYEFTFPESEDPNPASSGNHDFSILSLPGLPPSLRESLTAGPRPSFKWFLDFTEVGKHKGVVMSQSRMREIELIVNPLSNLGVGNGVHAMRIVRWVDLLMNPDDPIPSERYSATYTSPSNAHPPLQLRLTSPDEPGFFLERVPVQNVKQVWGILEIVREQCWLNEMLTGLEWTPDSISGGVMSESNGMSVPMDEDDEEVTDAELQAVLIGEVQPIDDPMTTTGTTETSTLPTSTTIPASSSSASNTSSSPDHKTKLILTSPERPPITGLVEIVIAYDSNKPKGVHVNVTGGPMGGVVDFGLLESMEEVCRRGGVWGLPGRVWMKG